MNENELIIFHVYRKDGTPVFLHPFKSGQNIIELIEKNELKGLYGREPRVESLTLLRNDMYRLVEQIVKEWANEKKFIPRFLMTAGIFLVTYFVMSVVVRDPIPMIDELIVALLVSAGFYMFMVRRDADSKTATEMKIKLRTKIDEIVFNEDPFVQDVEAYLQKAESFDDLGDLLDSLISDDDSGISSCSDEKRVSQLGHCISLMYDAKDFRKHEKMFLRMKKAGSESAHKRMLRWMSSRKVDPFFFAVYAKMKKKMVLK